MTPLRWEGFGSLLNADLEAFEKNLLHATLKVYILKFIVIPSGINFITIIVETLVIKSKTIR